MEDFIYQNWVENFNSFLIEVVRVIKMKGVMEHRKSTEIMNEMNVFNLLNNPAPI